MGSVPAELSLDLRPTFVPKTITDFLSTLPNSTDNKLSLLNDFIARLEDEFRKIDAFKRELPLSMLLLNDAISVLKEESEKCMSHKSQPVLEEFIPLKKECDDDDENNNKECRDKKNWMSSVQLWNTTTTNNVYDQKQHHHKLDNKKNGDERQYVAEDPFQPCSSRDGGGRGFLPFSTYTSIPVTTVALPPTKDEKEDTAMNRLSLLTPPPPAVKNLREGCSSSGSRTNSNRALSSSPPTAQPSLCTGSLQQQHQASRKQRRCWSPELHRRFVNALQKLGGSQVATPKQIRELMQVDGLTNDEVKSHLQKYRLHTRRVPSANTNQPVVVMGGLWMSQDQYNDSSKGSSSGSGSSQSPLHLATGSRVGMDGMENDGDAKSESYSWKSHIHNKTGKVGV